MVAKATSYSDVAQRLIESMKKAGALPSLHTEGSDAQDPKEPEQQTQQDKCEKNIKRRVYDALNV